jgi:hypothetical protein
LACKRTAEGGGSPFSLLGRESAVERDIERILDWFDWITPFRGNAVHLSTGNHVEWALPPKNL